MFYHCRQEDEVVPLFEADKEEDLEDVYDESQIFSKSNSSGRLASLLTGEVPDDEFVVINKSMTKGNAAAQTATEG